MPKANNLNSKKENSALQVQRIQRFEMGEFVAKNDVLAVEAPLEIKIARAQKMPETLSITMRTPGQDVELALGLLFAEGFIQEEHDVEKTIQLDDSCVVLFLKNTEVQTDITKERTFLSNSSCGVCGKSSLDFMRVKPSLPIKQGVFQLKSTYFFALLEKLDAAQSLFAETGGNHAASLFDLEGNLLAIREDVGRHNALDKLMGWAFLEKTLPLSRHVLLLSGRISFELVQKAAMAGISIIVAVGAPSSLAVDLALELGICLVGFLKKSSFNVYGKVDGLGFSD